MLQRVLARQREGIEALGEELQVLAQLGDVIGADWRHLRGAGAVFVRNRSDDAAAIALCHGNASRNQKARTDASGGPLSTSTGTSAARGRVEPKLQPDQRRALSGVARPVGFSC